MSTLVESTDNLSPVKYGHLLEAISQHIKASVKDGSLMQIKSAPASTSLRFVIDKIAEDVSKQFASSNKYRERFITGNPPKDELRHVWENR